MKKHIFFLLFICFINKILTSQNISGVINSYAQVTNITGNINVVVNTTLGFAVNDKVLLMQMKGATVTQTNTVNYGNITAYNNAGMYEYNVIVAINVATKTITLQKALCKSFTVADVVQIIKVPQYANPTVTGTLTCQAWNGTTGGVLAFNASGTVTMNADIDVSNNGFKGGAVCNQWFGCGSTSFFSPQVNCTAGQKGESIAKYVLGQENGRGHLANGGGGAENGNNGGGGGSNFSSGGIGGNEYSGCGTMGIQGRPGELLNYSTTRIFLGGGGGGGFADNGQVVTAGGNGGGAVLIKANTISGNNRAIKANGQSVTTIANDEASGGGGGGGSIFLMVSNYTSLVNIETRGGSGGSNNNQIFTSMCHGPGGGGSGGILWLINGALPANVNFIANGGAAGLVLNPISSCYNTSWGAAAGSNGGIQYNLDTNTVAPVYLGNDTTLCTGDTLVLNAGTGYASYLWTGSINTQTYTVTTSGTYSVQVANGTGCTATDQINITFNPSSTNNINGFLCPGQSYTLPDGSQTSVPGTFYDTVPNSKGCDSIITTVVVQEVNTSSSQDINICLGQSVTLPNGTVVNTSSTHSITIPNAKGCDSVITYNVIVNPLPVVTASANPATIQEGQSTTLTAVGVGSYSWNPPNGLSSTIGSTVTANPEETTTYCVEITDSLGCKDTACVIIHVTEFPCPPPEKLAVPNAFSPNGDFVNDEFCLQGWVHCADNFNIKIFDRWGEKVFESNDPEFCWNGEYRGVTMDAAVFVYSIRAINIDDGKVILKSGNITLIK